MKQKFNSEEEALAYKEAHQLLGRVPEKIVGTTKWALNFPLEAHAHSNKFSNKKFVVRSNDHERSPLDCETWEQADRLSAKLNAETDQDTKFWVEAKAD